MLLPLESLSLFFKIFFLLNYILMFFVLYFTFVIHLWFFIWLITCYLFHQTCLNETNDLFLFSELRNMAEHHIIEWNLPAFLLFSIYWLLFFMKSVIFIMIVVGDRVLLNDDLTDIKQHFNFIFFALSYIFLKRVLIHDLLNFLSVFMFRFWVNVWQVQAQSLINSPYFSTSLTF